MVWLDIAETRRKIIIDDVFGAELEMESNSPPPKLKCSKTEKIRKNSSSQFFSARNKIPDDKRPRENSVHKEKPPADLEQKKSEPIIFRKESFCK